MPFEIIRNDITNMRVDAIVNTANPQPVIGSGVDAAIHAKAGPKLLAARKKIGPMESGQAYVTPGFMLSCQYVIHTVGPVWMGGTAGEADALRRCYANSLQQARRHLCRSVAFPLISTGNYGFPKKLALEIAVETIRQFLEVYEMQIYLVVFGKDTLELSGNLVNNIRSFIDEAYVHEQEKAEYSFSVSRFFHFVQDRFKKPKEDALPKESAPPEETELFDDNVYASEDECIYPPRPMEFPSEAYLDNAESDSGARTSRKIESFRSSEKKSRKKAASTPFDMGELTRMAKATDAGFSETLLKLIDRSGEKDADVYKRANIGRQHFSKIRNNPQYKPSKATAVAFALALELDLEETRDLIGRAGYALSRSNTFDIIIEYFITHERYDIYEINLVLFEFDQSLLGA